MDHVRGIYLLHTILLDCACPFYPDIFVNVLGNPSTGERSVSGATRLEKLSRWDLCHAHLNKEAEAKGNCGRPLINQDKHKRGKDFSTNVLRADKVPPNTRTKKENL